LQRRLDPVLRAGQQAAMLGVIRHLEANNVQLTEARSSFRVCRVVELLDLNSDDLFMVPVEDRSKVTLLPLIQGKTAAGTTIVYDWQIFLQVMNTTALVMSLFLFLNVKEQFYKYK